MPARRGLVGGSDGDEGAEVNRSGGAARSAYRVLIVEDHVLFAESLELALTVEGYDAVRLPPPRAGATARRVVTDALATRPQAVLLDLQLGEFGDAEPLIRPLAAAGVNVVMVTSTADRARLGGCVQRGARAAVSKSQPLNEIMGVVRRLHQGQPVMTLTERDELLEAWQSDRAALEADLAKLERLSQREREVLGALMAGRTVREIAHAKVVSEATVRTQVKAVLAKLGVASQLAAVGLAHQVGWRPPAGHDPADAG